MPATTVLNKSLRVKKQWTSSAIVLPGAMNRVTVTVAADPKGGNAIFKLVVGILSGLAIGYSAYIQGQCSAASCDAYGETGKGFAQDLIVVGLCETIAIFVMAFTLAIVA